MRRAILTLLILAAAAVQAQDPFAYKIYKVTGPPGATEVYPSNMAEDGRIVGSARVNGVYGAFSGKLEDGYKVLPKLPWGAEASCYGGSADGRSYSTGRYCRRGLRRHFVSGLLQPAPHHGAAERAGGGNFARRAAAGGY